MPNVNIAGASGEELAKPQYRATKFAVRLIVNSNGPGNCVHQRSVDPALGRDVVDRRRRDPVRDARRGGVLAESGAVPYCANTAVSATKGGSSGNCSPLIGGSNLVNSAIVGDGSIDSRAYAEIVSTNKLYPLMKVDLTCSNTYAAYANGMQAPDGTPCDDGGTIVNSKSSVRNMTWWDLAYLGNLVENGRTGAASQSNFRMMVFNYVKNLTLYRITHEQQRQLPLRAVGVDGLTVWGVKLQTPSTGGLRQSGRQPATRSTPARCSARTTSRTPTRSIPASASKPTSAKLTTGSAHDVERSRSPSTAT